MSALPRYVRHQLVPLLLLLLGVINVDAQVSNRAFDLGMPELKLDGPEISRPPVDLGSLSVSQ